MLNRSIKISFINPPHADWSLANNLTYFAIQSHYQYNGKYKSRISWKEPLYKWNHYKNIGEVIEQIIDADIILFSSYIWNYKLLDSISAQIKEQYPDKILVLGGPHIGTNEPTFLASRSQYDLICSPTKPGEIFIEDLIDSFIDNNHHPLAKEIAWEISSKKERSHLFDHNYSIYEEHFDFFKKTADYAREQSMEPFIALETTRGCPYKCVYCEWGGGTGTKIYTREIDLVKRDILAIKNAGYRDVYLTDANFGAFLERDLEIFKFAWENKLNLTDISTVKTPNLSKRKILIDSWFQIVGNKIKANSKKSAGANMWEETAFISIVPTVSIQSISDEAMKISKRIDLPSHHKIELSKYIHDKCQQHGFPVPALELIMGMPGSTLSDFYDEMELIWNFKAWNSYRHDYMFLPDSDLNSQLYKDKFQIETIDVFSDIVDEDGIDNWEGLFQNQKTHFKTIRSCFSFTREEMREMWFMNLAGNYLLKYHYEKFSSKLNPGEFARKCFRAIKSIPDFIILEAEIFDLFNPLTPPRSIRRLRGRFRREEVEDFLKKFEIVILASVMHESFKEINP